MNDQKNTKIEEEIEPSSFKLIASLGIAGFFSGLLLASAYLFTLPIIEANKAETLKNAIYKVLKDCKSFTAVELKNNTLMMAGELHAGNKSGDSEKDVLKLYAGYNEKNELIGFAIPGSEPGFQDIISVIYGYNATHNAIIGFEVLESKETPGLGDKIFKDADFQINFKSLAVSPEIVPVKKGQKKLHNEIETITGATISSKAIVRLLNKSMSIWKEPIREYMESINAKIDTTEK